MRMKEEYWHKGEWRDDGHSAGHNIVPLRNIITTCLNHIVVVIAIRNLFRSGPGGGLLEL